MSDVLAGVENQRSRALSNTWRSRRGDAPMPVHGDIWTSVFNRGQPADTDIAKLLSMR